MKAIGGYLKSDLLQKKVNPYFSSTLFSNGRTCLSLILDNLNISKLYIPSYICNSLIDVIRNKNIFYEVYSINLKFEPTKILKLEDSEFFLYINYFGICSKNLKKLSLIYGKQLIIDNTMAFFANNDDIICFNSARKFFGVPDGAYINGIDIRNNIRNRSDVLDYHIKLRDDNRISKGYKLNLLNEDKLNIINRRGSHNSLFRLKHTKYEYIKNKRLLNFNYLDRSLNHLNRLSINKIKDEIPMSYPILLENEFDIKFLHYKKIFVPYLWKNMYYFDYQFTNPSIHNIIALPVDQNCNIDDLKRIIDNIKMLIL